MTTNSNLIQENIGLLKSIVLRFTKIGRIEDSEIYSVACLGLVEASISFDSSKAKFSTWATKIINQKIIQFLRKNKKQKSVELFSLDAQERENCLADNNQKSIPIHLLSLINPTESDTPPEKENKLILSMHYLDGKSWSEIGRKIGITREAVRQRANKFIKNIQKNNVDLLGNCFYSIGD